MFAVTKVTKQSNTVTLQFPYLMLYQTASGRVKGGGAIIIIIIITQHKSADNVQFFMKYKYDYAGVRCIEDLARTLNVDISTTSDIKSKVAHALFSSLNV